MNNISNKGLITYANGKTYVTDVLNYSGTYIIDVFGNATGIIKDALMWYSVVVGNEIYFSNQKYKNYLCVYDTLTGKIGLVKEIACRNIVLNRDKLYFIEEESKNIYSYSVTGRNIEKVSDVKAEVFTIYSDIIYFSSSAGIGMIRTDNNAQYALLSSVAENIGFWNNMMLFSDFNSKGVMSVYMPSTKEFFRIDSIKTDSFITYENYIYAINNAEGNSIFRIDISKGEIMRVYGESAYNLHIIDTDLYFMNKDNVWTKMSVNGDSLTYLRLN